MHIAALDTVLWLASWIRSGLVHVTLVDLLRLEQEYPMLMQDIDRAVWQVELVKDQMSRDK